MNQKHVQWLRANRIPIIEDCAQAIQGSDSGLAVGRIGDAAVFSFNGSKHLPAGEGGLIATDDDALASFVNDFIMSVQTPLEVVIRRFNDGSAGWNYRLGSMTASLAEALIHGLPERVEVALRAHETLRQTLRERTWLPILGEPFPNDFAPLGCPVRLCRSVPGFSLAESRALLYFALRFAGVPASVWVPDTIPSTRRLQRFYEKAHRNPDTTADTSAKVIADGHIVLATNAEASLRFGMDGPLNVVLETFERLLES